MDVIRKLLGHLGEYKRPALIAPLCTLVAVGMEVLIPYIMAMLIDQGISRGDMGKVWLFGGIMLACAFVSLVIDSASAHPTCEMPCSRRSRLIASRTSTSSALPGLLPA